MKNSLILKINSLKQYRLFFTTLAVSIIFFNILFTILQAKEKYISTDYWSRFPMLKKTYNESVYGTKYGPFIDDEIIYSYAGGAFITGTSPILINPEAPPLGKYLIGLSILLFKNENIIILFSGIYSLIILFLIGRKFFSSSVTALIPPLILSFEPLFKNQFIRTPLLDIMHLGFMLSSFYFFIKAINTDKKSTLYFLIASIFLGGFISTKFFGVGVSVVAAWLISVIIYKNKKQLTKLLLVLPVAGIILLLTYVRVLFTNYPLSQFLGIQKWIFLYNKGHIQNAFTVWPLLLLNRWHTWWGDRAILSDAQWNFLWPIATIITFVTIVLYISGRIPRKRGMEMIMAWIVFYLALLSLSDATVRYFIILLPMLYLVCTYSLEILLINFLKIEKNLSNKKLTKSKSRSK